jgi:hypothetical protein
MASKQFDSLDFIMAYENGELDDEAIVDGFQHLINNRMAWSLQGSYGRMAHALIEGGHCSA